VYYDRAASSASRITAIEIEASPVANARLLHLSGITPALSPYAAKAVSRAIAIAKQAGVAVSFDINYRSKLWSPATAREALEPLLGDIDLLMCPLADADAIFDIHGSGHEVAAEFHSRYETPAVVITMGGDGAVALDQTGEHLVKPYELKGVVDRVGAGDAFNAGVLMGHLKNDLALGLRYGMAMAALKHTIPGDLLLSTRGEIDAAVAGSIGGINR
jgi:2-dehydro-3-deoxygluconokinase